MLLFVPKQKYMNVCDHLLQVFLPLEGAAAQHANIPLHTSSGGVDTWQAYTPVY
jgi:hypothetical protein